MGASLTPSSGGSPIVLDKPIILIGRNDNCDIALESSVKVSRRHCCIVQCGDKYLVRDLGSMNGVRVNTQRVVETELQQGDTLSVADVTFTFRRDDGGRKVPQSARKKSPQAPDGEPTAAVDENILVTQEPLPESELESSASTFGQSDSAEGKVVENDGSQSGKFVSV